MKFYRFNYHFFNVYIEINELLLSKYLYVWLFTNKLLYLNAPSEQHGNIIYCFDGVSDKANCYYNTKICLLRLSILNLKVIGGLISLKSTEDYGSVSQSANITIVSICKRQLFNFVTDFVFFLIKDKPKKMRLQFFLGT